jgi:hypothetical protein
MIKEMGDAQTTPGTTLRRVSWGLSWGAVGANVVALVLDVLSNRPIGGDALMLLMATAIASLLGFAMPWAEAQVDRSKAEVVRAQADAALAQAIFLKFKDGGVLTTEIDVRAERRH